MPELIYAQLNSVFNKKEEPRKCPSKKFIKNNNQIKEESTTRIIEMINLKLSWFLQTGSSNNTRGPLSTHRAISRAMRAIRALLNRRLLIQSIGNTKIHGNSTSAVFKTLKAD